MLHPYVTQGRDQIINIGHNE